LENSTPVVVDNPPGSVQGIAVLGSDVYIAAYKIVNGKGRAMYWKNNVPAYLSDSNHEAESRAIAVVKQ
jgi:hypothetical protein